MRPPYTRKAPGYSVSIVKTRIALREVGAGEAEALTRIHAEAFANYWNVGDFNDFFSISGTRAWLAETDSGEAVGMVVLRVQFEQADIITIAVRPAFRRQGIGRALVSQSLDMAKELGANTLFLDVEDGNDAALALYRALGLTVISRRKLYYRQKDGSYTDALVMTGKLA